MIPLQSISGHSDGEFAVASIDENHSFYFFEVHTDSLCIHSFSYYLFHIIGVCLLIFLLYFIFGSLYNRIVNGAQGRNQIPHLRQWCKLGHAVADKCDYIFRCQGPPDIDEHVESIDTPILPM